MDEGTVFGVLHDPVKRIGHGQDKTRRELALRFAGIDQTRGVGYEGARFHQAHQVGDELLKIVASRLKSIIRVEDTIARHGGDEFVIVISHLREENKIEKIAQKITNNLNKYVEA